MPLSKPATREKLHTRVITCQGYKREDGLYDIEGHMVDTKAFDFPNQHRGGVIKKDEALHDMWARITIDKTLMIHDAEACIDYAPYNYCHSISDIFKSLIGVQIARGWRKQTQLLMGGTKGCTHLTELLGPMATTAYQTLSTEIFGKHEETNYPQQLLNTCHSLAETSPVIKEFWPQAYKPGSDND
jgi:hypothetical protein